MEYYTTGIGNAFMGWDNSSGNMIIANDAYFTGNDVVGINAYGTLEAGNLYIQSAVSTGNIAGGNLSAGSGTIVTTGNVDGGNVNVTGNVNSNQGYFTGNVTVVGTLTSTSNIVANTSGIFFGDAVTGNNAIIAGVPAFTSLGSNVVAQFSGNVNSYSQINFENISSGNRASTDYIATADNGNDTDNYVNMGIASSTYDYPDFAAYGPNDAYLHNNGGNLLINPETSGKVVKIIVGGTATADLITTISAAGLTMNQGNIDAANITSSSGRVNINPAGGDVDFSVSGDTLANVFYVDAGTSTASFGSSTQTTNAVVAFNATNSVLMPVGNTQQRPGTGVVGMLRFNTVGDALEVYDSTGWTEVGTPVFTVIADEQFNGDGSTVAYTLGSSQTTASCIVSINGVVQIPTIAYSVSGTTLTFTEAPEPGDIIDVRQLTTTTTVTSISNTGGNAIVQPNPTAANVDITGNLIPTSNVTFNLGSSTARWNELFLAGNTITLGSTVIKNTGGNTIGFFGPDGTTPATIDSASVDTTTIANGTSSMSVIASGGNIRANVGGATIISLTSGGIENGQANGVGNIGTSSTYFNTAFVKATSAQYADLAEKYEADAEYAPGTVVVFGGDKEVTVSSVDADRAVAGVVSTNPSYIMNGGLTATHVATVALTGRVPCRVTGTVRKGDLMVSAGYGVARAEADPRVGTVIGKALENHEGTEGVIEVVVGRF
jgi:hypothetical protein